MTTATKRRKRRSNNEGTLFQRGDGRWTARITLPNGKPKSWVRKTEREARAELKRALLELEKGIAPADGRITVTAFLGRWLEAVQASVRPRTYESYALNVHRLSPLLGKFKLTALAPPDVQRAYGELLAGAPNRPPLSKRSVQQAGTVLHTALEAAVKWGMVGRNVTDAVSPPRPERRQMKTLSADQLDALFRATAGDRHHALWVLLGTTGMRVGEALGTGWESVDLTARTLKVQRALQRQRHKGLVLVEPKSASSRRTVHLPTVAVEALRAHKTLQMRERMAAGPGWDGQDDLVFTTAKGGPLDPAWVNYQLHRALNRAELPRIRVHDLRHTAATLLLAGGKHPKTVADLLGHSTISLTLNTYSHTTPALHQDAADYMDGLFERRAAG